MELSEKKLQELKENKISIEDLYRKYFYTQKYGVNVDNILKLLNDNICSFQEIVDKFKSMKDEYDPCLYVVLYNKELFEELIETNRLTQNNLRYLLNRFDKDVELYGLCNSTPLIKHILNAFVFALDKEIVDRFNRIIKNIYWCKEHNIHTLFELIEYHNKDNEEILKLNELNSCIYSFDLNESQKLELIELLKDNEVAQNRIKELIDNNLESNYNFDSLMQYLKKKEKKNLINI